MPLVLIVFCLFVCLFCLFVCLFVLFVLFHMCCDQVIRADIKELWELQWSSNAPYAYTPFCDSNKDTDGFRYVLFAFAIVCAAFI
jgi:hypothetical protein